jgi:cyclophilin family peptidyl-prolyl cis-trans isomerase/HEAT repeat protein
MELVHSASVVPIPTHGMGMPTRLSAIALGFLLMLCPRPGVCQTAITSPVDTAALQRLLTAEDARGTGSDGLTPLLTPLAGRDTLLRRLAVRGLGRLQRPELGRRLLPSLNDPVPAVRAEAANAVAQSMRGVQRGDTTSDSTRLSMPQAQAALTRALAAEADRAVVDALAQSLGRLRLPDSAAARQAEDAIRSLLATQATPGVVHGLYTLARARRFTGNLEPASLPLLRSAAVTSPDTVVRRLALLTLATADGLDSATAVQAARDKDYESRRMALRGSGTLSPQVRASLVHRALSDPSSIVRTEAVAAARLGKNPPDCTPILTATRDADPYVVLAAIDSLGSGCADRPSAAAALRRMVIVRSTKGPPDHSWQVPSHALLSLARLDTTSAAKLLPSMAESKRWEARQYAARAAAVVGSRPVLLRLAGDPDHNVQEAAIAGLASTEGHEADSVYLGALSSSGYQVALAAATALKGSPHPDALPRMLDAFDRLSASRSENAKDPRVALLERIGELGTAANAARLRPYLADYDTVVATMAATMLTKWTGDTIAARPAPLPIRAEPLAEIFLERDIRLRVTMAPSSGGGSFTVRLFPDEAPATVARVLRLVREGFYDGKVFQRVEPNFVIQGGGPDANEYVGDSRFMRDELTPRTHARGTLGISARGRDTGDGQWFINLVDNPLLDHEFTIFGRIESGRAVAERILEGDQVGRVEAVRPSQSLSP